MDDNFADLLEFSELVFRAMMDHARHCPVPGTCSRSGWCRAMKILVVHNVSHEGCSCSKLCCKYAMIDSGRAWDPHAAIALQALLTLQS